MSVYQVGPACYATAKAAASAWASSANFTPISIGTTGAAAVAALSWAAANVRCRYQPEGGWKCDIGEPEQQGLAWQSSCFGTTAKRDTLSKVYDQCMEVRKAHVEGLTVQGETGFSVSQGGSANCQSFGAPPGQVTGNCTGRFWRRVSTFQAPTPNYTQFVPVEISAVRLVTGFCPDGQAEISPGKCTTSEDKWDSKSPAHVAPLLEPRVRQDPAGIADDVLDSGKEIETEGPTQVTGPPSVQHEPKTTTVTDGNGQQKTKTETTTSHIDYVNNTFTWYNTTIINHFDGSTEVITEKPKPDDRSECEKNPDAINCQARDVPDGPEVTQREIPVTFTPDAGWGGEGQCPAPQTVSVLGQAVTIDNTVVCTFLAGIRPVVVAMFGLAGALIFIGGLKQ